MLEALTDSDTLIFTTITWHCWFDSSSGNVNPIDSSCLRPLRSSWAEIPLMTQWPTQCVQQDLHEKVATWPKGISNDWGPSSIIITLSCPADIKSMAKVAILIILTKTWHLFSTLQNKLLTCNCIYRCSSIAKYTNWSRSPNNSLPCLYNQLSVDLSGAHCFKTKPSCQFGARCSSRISA